MFTAYYALTDAGVAESVSLELTKISLIPWQSEEGDNSPEEK